MPDARDWAEAIAILGLIVIGTFNLIMWTAPTPPV